MATIEVRVVATPQDHKLFLEFPWQHYQDDANWTPPLVSQRKDLLNKQKNPAWEYMEGDYFLAWRGGTVVGTIAAFINHRHNEHAKERVGFFGMFESINDASVAGALLETACAWIRERGYMTIRGPMNFTTHEECGVLVDNFSPPMVLMPYNPPHYSTLIEGAGFSKVMDVYSLYFDRELAQEANAQERMQKASDRAMSRSGVTIRPIDMKNRHEEFKKFRDIYNAAWHDNWGFVPMTDRELDALIESLGMFVDPNFAFFAECDGKPVGFSLAIPNLNEALAHARPNPRIPELFTLLGVVWHWKIRRTIRGLRLPLMGVLAEHREKGVELALLLATMKAALPSQYRYMDSGWILETNKLISISLKLGNKIYKTHRFYERQLS